MADTPISPARFAEALRGLSLATLQLKVLELRNDIAHLDYSNEQLLPYARGTATALDAASAGLPDPDCIEAIRENMVVIERRLEQLRLVRVEVEQHRGVGWSVFQTKDEEAAEATAAARRATTMEQPAETAETAEEAAAAGAGNTGDEAAAEEEAVLSATTNGTTNGTTGTTGGNPWTDGTFQTGTIRNGTLHMDPVATADDGGDSGGSRPAGGRHSDEQLRRLLQERLAADSGLSNGHADADDGDGDGLHL